MKYIFIISLLLCLISCKNEPKTATPPALNNTDLNTTKTSENVSFNSEKNQLLFENYLAIKAAMVNTNSSKIEKTAKEFVLNFSGDETYATAQQIASLISNSQNIKKQREFFVGLTEQVTKILKSDIKSGKIHQQYCPMAFEGEGAYWLSNSKEIRNPYFGDIMLACGEVTKIFQ